MTPRPRVGSLFSGVGGLDMAVHAAFDAVPAWFAEIDPAPAKVLAHHFPDVPNLGDVSTVNWAAVPPVEIITAGFPCQDVSVAGRRKGIREGTRSGLWSYVAAAIGVFHPELVIIENVRGLLSAKASRNLDLDTDQGDLDDAVILRAIGAVLGDLADLGFDAEWGVFPASAVGAPHRRDRVFIVARPADAESIGLEAGPVPVRTAAQLPEPARDLGTTPDPERFGLDGRGAAPGQAGGARPPVDRRGPDTWGKYADAVHRWERLTRPAPAPTEPNRNGRPRLAATFAEWMMGWPDGWVTAPALGLTRTQQLKIIGNGVVPQQAHEAIRQLTDRLAV